MKLNGIFPPLTTPFQRDGSVDLLALRSNLANYDRVGLAGYVVTGSTGESVLLSEKEMDEVWAAVTDTADPRKILIAGTGADSTDETIFRTNRAADLGYAVGLVKTPYYYKPQMSERALVEHFYRVADASRIPILIYSVPQFTGIAVEAATVARMAEHPNIIGIKESSGNVQRVTEIIHAAPQRFQTLVGSASTIFASLTLGAVGGILALANVLPKLCVDLYETTVAGQSPAEGEAAAGAVLQHVLLPGAVTIVGKHGVPGVKYAMDCVGYHGGAPRPPLLALDEAGRKEVNAVLEEVSARTTQAASSE